MERIEALIRQLNEQFSQQAGPAPMLGTLQLLQFELGKLQLAGVQTLGTSKVAVVLPQAPASNSVSASTASAYEKYAPKPAAEPRETKEVKETVLVDNGSLSLVQKNGQLDMVFDPMNEIPTLSHQPRGNENREKEINDHSSATTESINDKLKQGKTELIEILKESPVKDLRKAIGINDRFLFINELFRGDENAYERSIKTINNFSIYPEAEFWISRELKLKLNWNEESQAIKQFDQLIRRRFS